MAHHSQKIVDPNSVQLHIMLKGGAVSITDKDGMTVKFSAQLTPEVLGVLQEIEKKYYRSLSGGLST